MGDGLIASVLSMVRYQCRNSGATVQKAARHLWCLIWMEPSREAFKSPELGRVMRKKGDLGADHTVDV